MTKVYLLICALEGQSDYDKNEVIHVFKNIESAEQFRDKIGFSKHDAFIESRELIE